jgi:hypothetical protein
VEFAQFLCSGRTNTFNHEAKLRETCKYVFRGEQEPFSFDPAFDDALAAPPGMKRLNILIASLGFYLGGGEIVPIHIANELQRRGHNVTFLAIGHEDSTYEPGVRRMLAPSIPVLCKEDILEDSDLFRKYRFDLVSSTISALNISSWNYADRASIFRSMLSCIMAPMKQPRQPMIC